MATIIGVSVQRDHGPFSVVEGVDCRLVGRAAARLGVGGLDVREVIRYVTTGACPS